MTWKLDILHPLQIKRNEKSIENLLNEMTINDMINQNIFSLLLLRQKLFFKAIANRDGSIFR